jgi:hypothetical protein
VIYYTHSTEPFTGLDAEYWKRISCGRSKALGRIKVPKATEDKFKLATDLS